MREAGGGEQCVERDVILAEDPWPPGSHIGRRDKELERAASAHRLDIDLAGKDVAKRVMVERVGLIRREEAAEQAKPEIARRAVKVPAAEKPVNQGSLE